MLTVLIVVQIILAFVLVSIILMQKGKGAEMGVSFGAGAADTLFGSTGPMPFLAKVTWALAFLFMLNSVGITYMVYHANTRSLVQNATIPSGNRAVPVKIPVGKKQPKGSKGAPITK